MRLGRLIVGSLVGAAAGIVVALNVVIFSGAERGYETPLPEVFDRSVVLGVVVVAILVIGPVLGGAIGWRTRSRIRVREATRADVPAIATFFREAWALTGPDAPGWAGADEETIDHLTRTEVLEERIGGPDRRMFLAWDADRVVGFSATRRGEGAEAELAGIVVLQDMVGRGIGTPLLAAALGRLRRDGVGSVVVRTEADNQRALRFYRSRGFGDEQQVTEVVGGAEIALVELRRRL